MMTCDLLSPVLSAQSTESCVECGGAITLERIWLAEIVLAGDVQSINHFSRYTCPHCRYTGPHDYPFLVWRGAMAPSLVFVASAEHRRRKPGRRRGWWGRWGARWFAPFRDGLDASFMQLGSVIGPLRELARGIDHPAAQAALNDFSPGFGVRWSLVSVFEPMPTSSTLSANMAQDAWKRRHPPPSVEALMQCPGEQGDALRAALRALANTLTVDPTKDELYRRIDARDYDGVATLCFSALSKPSLTANPDLMLPFALNLAWALAVNPQSKRIAPISEALPCIESAVAFLSTKDEPARFANSLQNLGTLRLHNESQPDVTKRFDEAIEAYDKSLSIYLSLGDAHLSDAGQVLLHRSVAIRARLTGDRSENVESAIESASAARQMFTQCGDRGGEAKANSYLGVAYVNRYVGMPRSNWEMACRHFTTAHVIWQNLGDDRAATEEAINLAAAELELGRLDNDGDRMRTGFDRVMSACRLAEQCYPALVVPAMRAALVGYGYLVGMDGSSETLMAEALSLCDRLQQNLVQSERADELPLALNARAELCVNRAVRVPDAASLARALEASGAATEALRRVGVPNLAARHRLTLAAALMSDGRLDEAERICISTTDDVRLSSTGGISLSTQARQSELSYAAHHRLAFIRARKGELLAAVQTLDLALAPVLRRRAARSPVVNMGEPSHAGNEQNAWQEYWALLSRIESRTQFDDTGTGNPAIVARLAELRAQLASASDNEPVALSPQELIQAVPVGGAIILPMHWLDKQGLCVCLTRDAAGELRVTLIDCPGFEEQGINRAVAATPIWPHVCDEMFGEDANIARTRADDFTRACRWLGRVLAQPLLEHLAGLGLARGCPLTIMVHGKLCCLPLHAALFEVQAQTVALAERCTVTVAPALHWLVTTRREAVGRADAVSVLVVADSLGDLDGAGLEGALAQRAAAAGPCTLLARGDATSERVLARIAKVDFVHIAGHSEFHWDMPFRSMIALADGELAMAQLIERVDHAPRTVFMSSCSSGQSAGLQEAGDTWGFPLALHAWGVGSVLACLWEVDDVVMLLLCSEFYGVAYWRSRPASALQAAQHYLRHVSAGDALNRLSDVCHERPELLPKLQANIRWYAQLSPGNTPFDHPMFWASPLASGMSD